MEEIIVCLLPCYQCIVKGPPPHFKTPAKTPTESPVQSRASMRKNSSFPTSSFSHVCTAPFLPWSRTETIPSTRLQRRSAAYQHYDANSQNCVFCMSPAENQMQRRYSTLLNMSSDELAVPVRKVTVNRICAPATGSYRRARMHA
jgi:hypothetical protein